MTGGVPEGGVGGFKQGLVAEQRWPRGGGIVVGVGGDVLGWRPSKDLQPLEEHLLPPLQRLQHRMA